MRIASMKYGQPGQEFSLMFEPSRSDLAVFGRRIFNKYGRVAWRVWRLWPFTILLFSSYYELEHIDDGRDCAA